MLIDVFNRLFLKDKELKLFIVGRKPGEKALSHLKILPCYKNIFCTGELDSKKIEKYYQLSSLMLITSYQEGLGIVGLEAMSNGIPVVSTDCGGIMEYVLDD